MYIILHECLYIHFFCFLFIRVKLINDFFLQITALTYNLIDDSAISIVCTYGDTCAEEDIFIYAESGYKILINVTFVDINGHNGDYLLIKSGSYLRNMGFYLSCMIHDCLFCRNCFG